MKIKDLQLNAYRFTGRTFIETYHQYRPSPPLEIIHQALNYSNARKVNRIVDLGCGTGLGTFVWADYAHEVIGIEPSQEMSAIAEKHNTYSNIQFINAFGNKTSLEDNSTDIISISQAFHWMEPQSTLEEIQRILKPNGVLVIYDVFWAIGTNLKLERAYTTLFKKVSEITASLQEPIAHKWEKDKHLKNIETCNYFQFVKETYFHKTKPYNPEAFIGLALSQGGLEALLKRGFSETRIGLDNFKQEVMNIKTLPYDQMTYNYRVIFGILKS
jgi:ubiquinone/menaquinone biosynthesis C-methylase UbiE